LSKGVPDPCDDSHPSSSTRREALRLLANAAMGAIVYFLSLHRPQVLKNAAGV
jgi:hypothetical protein